MTDETIPHPAATVRPRRHRIRTALIWIIAVLVLVVTGFLVWSQIVMQGERPYALRAWRDDAVSIRSTDHGIVMTPTSAGNGSGLVFIPGAKVDPYAYLYKLSGIAESGTTVVITKPTLNLAFFDPRPLTTWTSDAPEVTAWFVGGHSLGGVRACMLADDPKVRGIVLFGSYCANDLSRTSLAALSIGGTDDALSTPATIKAAAPLLPPSAVFVEIAGANHARFGDYGVQPGDGEPTITSEQMRGAITKAWKEFSGALLG